MHKLKVNKEEIRLLTNRFRAGEIPDIQDTLSHFGLNLKIISPLYKEYDRKILYRIIDPFVQILKYQNFEHDEKPSMEPGEVKETSQFVNEFINTPERCTIITISDQTNGTCYSGAIGPTLMDETDQKQWALNVMEYGGSALQTIGKGTGLGTLIAAIYFQEAKKIAAHFNREFIGVLIESVTSAGKFWNAVGAKGLYRRSVLNAQPIMEALSYAMPLLTGADGLRPKTGTPRKGQEEFYRERITLIPGNPDLKQISGLLYKAIITVFYENSYRPQAKDFRSRTAHAAALSYYLRTLHEVCIDHVRDNDLIELFSDEELSSLPPAYWWKKEKTVHKLGVNKAGCTGKLIRYLP
ncbi:MAG: hypothetical protein G8237_06995 [Magnetococcales bacterium]|nr:hypothetical protein [Magnetococcales bacterium]NGZ06088.1 hypothetical protein [Magnetococcales bacterium]